MKKIDITLQNREMQEMWFEKISTDVYEIKTTSNYALNYARLILDENDNIVAFDPAGGPFMRVGSYTIDGKILTEVQRTKNGILFKTENKDGKE
jgi:hypothetical protein